MLSMKLSAIEQTRKQSKPLPTGIAPNVSSALFQLPKSESSVRARRWDRHLSIESRLRCGATLKDSASSKAASDAVNLGTARPMASTFPWSSVTMQAVDTVMCVPPNGKSTTTCLNGDQGYDLGLAMNYGFSAGSPQLLRFITEHVELIHNPPYADWLTCITCGNTSALDLVLRMLCNRGDTVLAEAYTYPGTIEMVKPMGLKLLGLPMDEEGLLPEALAECLGKWDLSLGPKPTALYTIPCGQNPTGATPSRLRRRDIYEIAEQHDLIIIEDDPYFFVHFGGEAMANTVEEYVDRLPKSYLSLDRSGRVLRLDATSKILSPGLRCGWLTGSEQLVQQFLNHVDFSTTSPNGPSQMMLYKLLDEQWGHVGFLRWLHSLSTRYRECRDVLVKACEQHLSRSCDWSVPSSGMMLWIRCRIRKEQRTADVTRKTACSLKNGDCQSVGPDCKVVPSSYPQEAASLMTNGMILRLEAELFQSALSHGVQVSKGSWFVASAPHAPSELAFRLTFAAAPLESLENAVQSLSKAWSSALDQ